MSLTLPKEAHLMVSFIRNRRLAVSAILVILLATAGAFGLAERNNSGNVPGSSGFVLEKPVFAHGVVDQSYIRTADTSVNEAACAIIYCQPFGQEFTPSAPALVGVDVELVATNASGDDTITVNIRKGNIGNPVLATASQIVPESIDAGLMHFDFPSPLAVTPGETYVLEVQATKSTHAWSGSKQDLYPRRQAIVYGRLAEEEEGLEGWDLYFQTYTVITPKPAPTPKPPTPTPTPKPTPTTFDLSITQTVSPNPVIVGQDLTYKATVINKGPDPATGVTLTDTLPVTTTYQSHTVPAGWNCTTPAVGSTSTVACNVGSLTKDVSAKITIVVKPTAVGRITNTAGVKANVLDLKEATQHTIVQPLLGFPWSTTSAEGAAVWYLSQGPHCDADGDFCGKGEKRYALDFLPPDTPGCDTTPVDNAWVTAAANGTVIHASGNTVEIDHGNGFRTGYFHLGSGTLQVGSGNFVNLGQRLGRPSCHGGFTTGDHLHFYVCIQSDPELVCGANAKNGIDIHGLTIAGWRVEATSGNRNGKMTKPGEDPRVREPAQCGIDNGCSIRNDLPPQLLKNANFEQDKDAKDLPDEWISTTSSGKFTRTKDIAPLRPQFGEYVGRHRASDNLGYTVSQQVSSLKAGKKYTVLGWVNIPNTSDLFTFKIQVKWHDSSNQVIDSPQVIGTYTKDTGGVWKNMVETLVAPQKATNVLVEMVMSDLNATIYVDTFIFRPE
jgi:uncharacterized repeat protein (TIGR01451 family)